MTSETREELIAEYKELWAANEAAPSWGAAVDARHERMMGIERALGSRPQPLPSRERL